MTVSRTARGGKLALTPITELVRLPELQMRAGGVNPEHAADLAEVLKRRGGKLPRVEVREVPGRGKLVTDGFHTVDAHEIVGLKAVSAYIRPGSWQDAVVDAATANNSKAHQALKRTQADKRRAVGMILSVQPDWSDRQIADRLGVSHTFVANIRRAHTGAAPGGNVTTSPPSECARTGRDGKSYGPRHQAPSPPPSSPPVVPVGVLTDGWRGLQLTEFLKADDHVWSALEDAGVETAGQLHDRLRVGETFGLAPGDVAALGEQLAPMIEQGEPGIDDPGSDDPPSAHVGPETPTPERAKPAVPSLKEFEPLIGRVIRWFDDAHAASGVPRRDETRRHLTAVLEAAQDLCRAAAAAGRADQPAGASR